MGKVRCGGSVRSMSDLREIVPRHPTSVYVQHPPRRDDGPLEHERGMAAAVVTAAAGSACDSMHSA